jgi:hypothetical protein
VYPLLVKLTAQSNSGSITLDTYETAKLSELNDTKFVLLNKKIDQSSSTHYDKMNFLKANGIDVSVAENNFQVNKKVLDVILGYTQLGETEFDVLFTNNTASEIITYCSNNPTPLNSIILLCLEKVRRFYSDLANTKDIGTDLITKISTSSFFKDDGEEYKKLETVIKGITEKDLDSKELDEKKLIDKYKLEMESVREFKKL